MRVNNFAFIWPFFHKFRFGIKCRHGILFLGCFIIIFFEENARMEQIAE